MGFIRGRIHPPPKEAGSDFFILAHETADFMKEFKNKPVLLEHDKTKIIGNVMNVFFGVNGAIMVELFINENLPYACNVMERIRNQELKGLSMNYSTQVDKNCQRFGKIVPVEISVVEEGAIEKSRIEAYGTHKKIYVSESGIREIHERIEEIKAGGVLGNFRAFQKNNEKMDVETYHKKVKEIFRLRKGI
jgi:hypothetical protein